MIASESTLDQPHALRRSRSSTSELTASTGLGAPPFFTTDQKGPVQPQRLDGVAVHLDGDGHVESCSLQTKIKATNPGAETCSPSHWRNSIFNLRLTSNQTSLAGEAASLLWRSGSRR